METVAKLEEEVAKLEQERLVYLNHMYQLAASARSVVEENRALRARLEVLAAGPAAPLVRGAARRRPLLLGRPLSYYLYQLACLMRQSQTLFSQPHGACLLNVYTLLCTPVLMVMQQPPQAQQLPTLTRGDAGHFLGMHLNELALHPCLQLLCMRLHWQAPLRRMLPQANLPMPATSKHAASPPPPHAPAPQLPSMASVNSACMDFEAVRRELFSSSNGAAVWPGPVSAFLPGL